MRQIVWSRQASADLRAIHDWIARDSGTTALRVIEQIVGRIKLLPEHPLVGRPGRVPNTRELIVPGTPYVVPYRVKDDRIEILRVYHARRKWPPEQM